MIPDPHELLAAAKQEIEQAADAAALERVRVHWLGRKGALSALMQQLPSLPPAERGRVGQAANRAKREIETWVQERQRTLHGHAGPLIDPSLPGERVERGHLHPLTLFARKVLDIWRSLGYDIHEGPELEDAWYNFDGLNVPADHPARDVQDTFFIRDREQLVLRTHSSTVQLRSVLHHANKKPPVKYVEVGKVYRHEATDATHESMFMQCDGVLIDRQVTMVHLITTLKLFIHRLYPGAKIRVRPSYFPFVEPGIELDVWWETVGKKGRWLELLGAGLVHPNVIKSMGLSPKQWQGFAFGMGLDRLALLEYGVPDVRLFYSGNVDFLQQW